MRAKMLTALLLAALLAAAAPAGAVEQPPFEATISRIDRDTRALMKGSSWHKGCPVVFADLRLIRLMYWGFDREAHHGMLVVHRRWSDDIVTVFRKVYRERFPIRRVRLVDSVRRRRPALDARGQDLGVQLRITSPARRRDPSTRTAARST